MTVRSLVVGLALGLFISGFTHFNDSFVNGSWFIGHHLPTSVFGLLVLVVLIVNPLIQFARLGASFSKAELAIVLAIGLAACGWPSFGYYRQFIPLTAMPNHWQGPKANWQANHVMRYLPGGDPAVADGHVQDWDVLVNALVDPVQRDADPVRQLVWQQVGPEGRRTLSAFAEGPATPDARREVLQVINEVLREGDLTPRPPPDEASLPEPLRELLQARAQGPLTDREQVRVNRWWLVYSVPDAVMPPPRGDGVLLADGEGGLDVVHDALAGRGRMLWPHELPWSEWWPTIRLWGAVGLLTGLAALCLSLIVHPQWSRHELLPYPIARFVSEVTARDANRRFPNVARQQAFWVGLLAMVFVHGINGLHAWYPQIPQIPLRLELGPLQELVPGFARVVNANEVFRPTLYFSVIAFCFFLAAPVSFSVGAATFVYGAVGAVLLARGVSFQTDYFGADKGNLLRFGAFVGMAGFIGYTGRRYYLNVILAALRLSQLRGTPPYAVWAARAFAMLVIALVVLLHLAGLDWPLATLFILLVLLTFLVLTRIVVETGMFFVQAWWLPVGILTGLLGFEAIGPTSYIVLAIGSLMLVGDPRTLLMPYLANGLQIAEQSGGARPARVAPWLLVMLLAGFVVAGVAVFTLTYSLGHGGAGRWELEQMPSIPFDRVAMHIAESSAEQTLSDATSASGYEQLGMIRMSSDTWGWMIIGLLLLVVTSVARLRLPWWPIHPVLFLVWGTMPASRLALSFLLGWLIKLAVVNVAGARGYRQALPLMVGIIAGELLMGLLWASVGVVYFAIEGLPPEPYRIYP